MVLGQIKPGGRGERYEKLSRTPGPPRVAQNKSPIHKEGNFYWLIQKMGKRILKWGNHSKKKAFHFFGGQLAAEEPFLEGGNFLKGRLGRDNKCAGWGFLSFSFPDNM